MISAAAGRGPGRRPAAALFRARGRAWAGTESDCPIGPLAGCSPAAAVNSESPRSGTPPRPYTPARVYRKTR
eukprot:767078-Hanusia_phi.AAC.1